MDVVKQESKSIKRTVKRVIRAVYDHLDAHKGSLYAILCALFVSLFGILYKKAARLSGSDTSTLRYIIQLITMICYLKYKNIPLMGPAAHRKLLLARSFVGIFAIVVANFAINFIDPSDVAAISHASIILTAIMARIFLKEKFGLQHLIALLFTVVGVLLMTKPSFLFKKDSSIESVFNSTIFSNSSINGTITDVAVCVNKRYSLADGKYDRVIGVILALIGAFGTGGIYVIIRKLCLHQVHFGVNTLYGTFFGLPASILTSVVLVVTGVYHNDLKCELKFLAHDIAFGLAGGLIAVLAQILLNLSLEHKDATMVAILRTTDVVFSFIFQFLILQIKSDYISMLGALAIILGTFTVLFFKIIKEKLKSKVTTTVDVSTDKV